MTRSAKRTGDFALAVVLTTIAIFSITAEILPTQPAWAAFPGTNGKIAFQSLRSRQFRSPEAQSLLLCF